MSLFSTETRTGRFVRTLSSSYALLLAATVYSLGVVPIILTYAGSQSLGLWALVVQFGSYLTLLDAGLSAACIRQFVGPIVRNDSTALASQFQNALALASVQGAAIALAGAGGGFLAPALGIPAEETQSFACLFFAQCLLVAWEFPFRPLNSLLLAKQRFEINYLVTAGGMVVSLGLVWIGMARGLGLWSLILAGGFQALLKTVTSVFCVARWWGLRRFFSQFHIRADSMRRLLAESGSFFSGTFFGTLAGMTQSTLLSRWFGLEGVAAWSVGSKSANLLSQLLSKLYESSFAGLSELFESGRTDRLLQRLAQLFGWVLVISLFAAVGVCLLNGMFIRVWTSARLDWPAACNVGMAFWLVALTASRGLAEQAKILLVWRWIRIGPAVEFVSWLGLALILGPVYSLPGFVWSIALSPIFSAIMVYGFGLRRKFLARDGSDAGGPGRILLGGGILFFLGAAWLTLFCQASAWHLVGTGVASIFFLLLAIPRLRRRGSSLFQTRKTAA